MASVEILANGFDDTLRTRHRKILQGIGCRKRNMWRGNADQRSVEVVECLLCDDRHDLGTPTAQPRVLFHSEEPARLRHLMKDRLRVKGYQTAYVDHCAFDAVRRSEFFGGRER